MTEVASAPARARWWRAVITAGALELGVFACVVFALTHADKLHVDPVNGTFQIFNPLRRLSLGQHVGRDFDTYLGLGPLYAMRAATWFTGADYRLAVLAAYLLNAGLYFVGSVLLARLVGLSRAAAASAAAALTVLAAQGTQWWMPAGFAEWWSALVWSIFAPGNSSLGLRSSAPVLVALALLAAHRWAHVGAPGRRVRTAVVLGALCGAALLWSNDYGMPTAAAIVLTAWIYLPRDARGGLASFTALVAAVAGVTALALLVVATRGAPGSWFDYNFRCVARDQGWYFSSDIVAAPYWKPVGLGVACVGALVWRRWRKRERPEEALLFLLTLATLGAGMLANLGHREERYFHPLYRTLFFVLPYVVATGIVVPLLRRRSAVRERAWRWTFALSATTAPLAGAALVILCAPVFVRCSEIAATRDYRQPEEAWVRELGGRGPAYLAKMAVVGRGIRAEAEAAGVPRERRVFSTYATAIDVIADAVQPTGNDYVIHALGSRRDAYVRKFIETAPSYVTTLRVDRCAWEPWIRHMNWGFYRELFARYEPWDETFHHVIWKPRARPLAESPLTAEVELRAAPTAASARAIVVRIAPRDGESEAQLVEVELEYAVAWSGPATAMRSVVMSDIVRGDPLALYGLPPTGTQSTFPVELVPGTEAVLAIYVRPEGAGTLERLEARARVVGPARELSRARLTRLVAADTNYDPWRGGVGRREGRTAFWVTDPTDVRDVRAGTRLRFAGSGERTVLEVDERMVVIGGSPLDAARDGFPNWIEVVEY